MIEVETLFEALAKAFPEAASNNGIMVQDTAGDMRHFSVELYTMRFAGLSLVQQHRMVKEALAPYLKSGALHAVSIKTGVSL